MLSPISVPGLVPRSGLRDRSWWAGSRAGLRPSSPLLQARARDESSYCTKFRLATPNQAASEAELRFNSVKRSSRVHARRTPMSALPSARIKDTSLAFESKMEVIEPCARSQPKLLQAYLNKIKRHSLSALGPVQKYHLQQFPSAPSYLVSMPRDLQTTSKYPA